MPTFTPSFTDPISAHIPLKIKEKIWAGEYIDLYVLLKSVRELATDSQLSGDLSIKGGQLTVTQPKIAAISNIHVWTSAFMIFMGVMLEKWPNKGQEYLKYMFNVRHGDQVRVGPHMTNNIVFAKLDILTLHGVTSIWSYGFYTSPPLLNTHTLTIQM